MQIDAAHEALRVRAGATFDGHDVLRVEEALAALGPFSRLTLDFTAVRRCDEAALVRLARVLDCVATGEVAVRGLASDHWHLLTCVGLSGGDAGPAAPSPRS